MSSGAEGQEYQQRLRLICHLPANNRAQSQAVDGFFTYLRRFTATIGGYTASPAHPTVFGGYWWDSQTGKWVHDSIVVCMIDYPLGKKVTAEEVVAKLHSKIDRLYRAVAPDEKEKQDVIWIVGHPVIQYAYESTAEAESKITSLPE